MKLYAFASLAASMISEKRLFLLTKIYDLVSTCFTHNFFWSSICNVFTNGGVEEKRILIDYSNKLVEVGDIQLFKVETINKDSSRGRVIQSY